MRNVLCSHTTNPNTPESDKLPEVLHDVRVRVTDGRGPGTKIITVRVMARDPGYAIDKVKAMSDEEFNALPRRK